MKNKVYAHLNEMPFNLPLLLRLKIALKIIFTHYNRYPDPKYTELVDKISKLEKVNTDEILVGAGSSALISLLILYFSSLSKEIVLEDPSFAYYKEFTSAFNIPTKILSLSTDINFKYTIELFDSFGEESVIFLTSPNNPIGLCMSTEFVEDLLIKWPKRIFVIDCAYLDFTDENYVLLLKKYNNILILKTLSKSLLAASIRVGYLLGQVSIIDILKTKVIPWSISKMSYMSANLILDKMIKSNFFSKKISLVSFERNSIINELKKINWIKVVPNQKGNSVFFEIINQEFSDKLIELLSSNGFFVKVFKNFNGNTAIRFTVCKTDINKNFISIIKSI